ncbi:sigma-70 family RNA polymerase sigma factor [Stieleria sp. JC731]|uniref:RNA polymerase sigma factor n=1 Tax=Pirellulaceae TaxID=2691357 RepID=UPI001E357C73|nr:sigma-70 family RNA polymerase sigma factor [Stieleria sp. JC731]MCC9599101.1 sigma-70 family RNA polymerase sigma factor [Stieleria sp. JC731]
MPEPHSNAHDLFEILVRENSRTLLAYIRSAVFDSSSIDDIWQETMMVAWRRIDDFDRSRPFAPWLRAIAANVILAHGRKTSQAICVDQQTLQLLDSRFEQLQMLSGDTLDEKLQVLRDCVSDLPDHYRTCIELRFLHDLKPSELSKRIGSAIESVKKRLSRGKAMLADCMNRKIAAQ